MKTFKKGIFAVIALAVFSLAACKKTGNSPSSTKTSQLSFGVQADNATTNLSASSSTGSKLSTNSTSSFTGISGLVFTAGTANISQFKLEAKRNNVEIEISSRSLTNVDLFAPSPSIADVTIDTGAYREIELRALLQKSSDTSAIPLKLTGIFTTSGGTVIPIEFELNDNVTIKSEVEDVTVTSTTDLAALIHIHLRKLEAGVTAADLEAATLTNDVIVISNSSNRSIYNKVLANFSNCGEGELRGHHKDGKDDNSGPGNNNDNSGHGSDDGGGHN
ncbi:MAG TPA: hypothetical protein VGM63_08380 [Mucilaginibacter sp.]